jgi:hypothetical protein
MFHEKKAALCFDADPDPDPTFYFDADADPDPDPTPCLHIFENKNLLNFNTQQYQFT